MIDCTIELEAVKVALLALFKKSNFVGEGDEIDRVYVIGDDTATPEHAPILPMRLGFTIKRKVVTE